MKTVAYEIAEQLGRVLDAKTRGQSPDHPTGQSQIRS